MTKKNVNYHNYRVNGKFAKRPNNQVVRQKVNYITLVVDSSGSMSGLRDKVVQFVNKWIIDNKEASQKYNQKTYITLITYSYTPQFIFRNVPIEQCVLFYSYYTGGMTALLDAQYKAITELDNTYIDNELDVSYMVNHITDGYENQSRLITAKDLVNLMLAKQDSGNWTFTFLVPPGNKVMFVNQFGIPSGNVQEWETTEQGIYEAEEKTSAGLFAYYSSRDVGAKSVCNFFSN